MRLLYITNGINGSGGLERVLSVKASLLAEDYHHQVSVLVLNNAHLDLFYTFSPKINFYSINVTGNPIKYFKSWQNGIQKVVDDLKPNVISVCDDGLKGFFIPKFLKTDAKIIYERHVSKLAETHANQSFISKTLNFLKWTLMERWAKRFSKFIVLTEGNKNEWKSLNNIEVIPNPLSFYPEESSDLNSKKVICVGKIAFQKGQDILLKVWDIVAVKYPDWTLELYGKENLEFLDTQNLPPNVNWFPPDKDIEQKYLDSSIYVMSSRFEGFGMVLIEAMSCGVPCVSFDCPYGPSDVISDNEDGFLVDNEDTSQLAQKLMALIEDKTKREKFGKAAKENVKRFAPGTIVKQWNNLFKSLLSENSF